MDFGGNSKQSTYTVDIVNVLAVNSCLFIHPADTEQDQDSGVTFLATLQIKFNIYSLF